MGSCGDTPGRSQLPDEYVRENLIIHSMRSVVSTNNQFIAMRGIFMSTWKVGSDHSILHRFFVFKTTLNLSTSYLPACRELVD